MTRHFYLWHRRLALWVLIPILVFSLSGLLHPLMRLTRPDAAQMFFPPPVWPADLKGPVLIEPDLSVAGLRPVKLGDDWVQQQWATRTHSSQFVSLATGQPTEHGAQDYAEQLARFYIGDTQSEIAAIRFITQFDAEYGEINRLLPVWMVEFKRDDQLRVYVDIRQDRLATLSDDTRRLLLQLFQWGHVWSFLDENDPLRNALFILMMSACTLLGLSGIYLFVVLPISKRRNARGRKVHAWGGLLISLALLMFVASGLVRTVEKLIPEVRGVPLAESIALNTVSYDFTQLKQRFSAIQGVRLHRLDREAVWQISQPRQPDQWVNASTGQSIDQGALAFAQQVAANANASSRTQALVSSERIHNFKADGDYGFIDKRLPVIALRYDAQTLYVDTRDAVLSKQVTLGSQTFGWIFRYLHKWRFADGLTKNGRDGLIASFILSICGIGLLGFILWLKGQRKRRAARRLNDLGTAVPIKALGG